MTPRFSSLQLLSINDETKVLNHQRLRSLHRNRCLHVYVSALTSSFFSLIPAVLLYSLWKAEADPHLFPADIRWGLILFTGLCSLIGLVVTYLIFRQAWVDPLLAFIRNPNTCELVTGQLVRGQVDRTSENRRQGSGWTGEVKYFIGNTSHTFFESFAKDITMDQYDWSGRTKEKGLESMLPAQVWILRRRTFDKPLRKVPNSVGSMFWSDLMWVLQRAWQGPSEALIGIEADKIRRISPKRHKSYADLKWASVLLILFSLTVFFFTLPGIPDARWIEVSRNLPNMPSLKKACEDLNLSFKQASPAQAEMLLKSTSLSEDWFKELQFTAWNLDFENLNSQEEEEVRSLFTENCREKILTENALKYTVNKEVQKTILYWLDDIAKSPRSVARLEMANALARALAQTLGTDSEKAALAQWEKRLKDRDPRSTLSLKQLTRWIQIHGSSYAEWQYPFQGRILAEGQL